MYNIFYRKGGLMARSKVIVSLNPELLERLDAYCDKVGATRSGLISQCLSNFLDNQLLTESLVKDVLGGSIDSIMKEFVELKVQQELRSKGSN